MSSHTQLSPGVKAGLRLTRLALFALTLSGCAAQMAYRDGRHLMAHDQAEAGIQKLREAALREPANAQYRLAYLEAEEDTIKHFLAQADRYLADDKSALALKMWQRVLALEPENQRARAGLHTLEMHERHHTLLEGAASALDNKQVDTARHNLMAILAERPDDEAARAMLRRIAEKAAPVVTETGLAIAFRKPISIEFQDAPLKQVFEVIARHSGLNFLFDKDVKGDTKTSIFLKNSTVESAIFFLLMTNQLEQQVMDSNTILIYPNVAAKQKEYQEMVVKTFFVANADVKMLANTLKTILKIRDVVVDEKLNLLIVRDSPEAIRLAERLVALQDVPEPEVMLDVEILEIKRSRLLALGIAWPTSVSLTPLSTNAGTALTLGDLQNMTHSSVGITGLVATVNASKTDGDATILANPRIRVRNKEKAKVVIGDKVPVITTTISAGVGGFASESVSYVDVGLTLNAEPTIYLNNEVAIRISLEVSNLVSQIQTKSGTTAYQIGTRQASTMLQLKDGETQVLAGLISNEDRSTGSKVPGFGDIPLLGRLFGSTATDSEKTEIVLSITPHLVRNIQRPEAMVSEFSAGTEGSFRPHPRTAAPASLAPLLVPTIPASVIADLPPTPRQQQEPGPVLPPAEQAQ